MKNTKTYKLAVFDLDGTLLDTSEGIISAAKYTIKYFGFQELDDNQMKSFIGPPIQESFARTYHLEGAILQRIATVFRDRYKNVDLLKAAPYAGIYDSLRDLRSNGIKLAVATYKREDYALEILNHFEFNRYFDAIHGADHNNALKKSDIVLQCIDELKLKDKKDVVLVGDTVHDENGALQVGVDFIGITYGFGYFDAQSREKSTAIGFAATPIDVRDLILGVNRK